VLAKAEKDTGQCAADASTHWPGWMWRTIIAIAILDFVWLATTPLTLTSGSYLTIGQIALCLPLGLWLARNAAGQPTLHTVLVGGTMLLSAWPALRIFNHLTMTTAFPLADPWLASCDQILQFDWVGYLSWLERRPQLIGLMSLTYSSLTQYSVLLFLILAVGSQPAKRCSEFLKLFIITAVACSTVGMFFPAQSASVFYPVSDGTFRHIPPGLGAYHLPFLNELRSNSAAQLDLASLPGLVTFPSFHTAMGVLAIYCARHYLALFACSLAVNLTMIASTPLFGAHYGIDIVAGAAMAGISIVALHLKVPALSWRLDLRTCRTVAS
jgi:hypothetical protein